MDVNGHPNQLVSNIIQNMFFGVLQKKECHTVFGMRFIYFLVNYPFETSFNTVWSDPPYFSMWK